MSSNLFLFADDTSILYSNRNLHVLAQTVNNELNKVSDWLVANKLTLNSSKFNFVIFRPRQKILPFIPNTQELDHTTNSLVSLENKATVKYLGVMVDSSLSWKLQY